MTQSFRRVVTGHDDKGRATIISDGPAPFVHVNKLDPEWYSTDLWRTGPMPDMIVAQPPESTDGPRRQMPTPHGTVLRINHFPPESEAVRQLTPEDSQRVFSGLGNPAAATFGKGGRHPLMHRTETVDYAIVLAGEITMVLDDQDVVLRAGDTLIQNGTNHAWANRSSAPAIVAFILIDARFDPDLAAKFPNALQD
jgi:quercetin dioxygenase-like cupin family protein